MVIVTRTITIELDAELRELAEQEAQLFGTTVPEAIRRRIAILVKSRRATRTGESSITYNFQGAIYLSDNANLSQLLVEELRRSMAGAGSNASQDPLRQTGDARDQSDKSIACTKESHQIGASGGAGQGNRR